MLHAPMIQGGEALRLDRTDEINGTPALSALTCCRLLTARAYFSSFEDLGILASRPGLSFEGAPTRWITGGSRS